MAGYWLSSFFCKKKRTRLISGHLYQTNLVNKGFIMWLLGIVFLRDTESSPEWATSILPGRVASHSAGFDSSVK